MLKANCVLFMVLILAQLSAQEINNNEGLSRDFSNGSECYIMNSYENARNIKIAKYSVSSEEKAILDSIITEYWEVENLTWNNKSKMEFQYDQYEKNTSEISYLWDPSGKKWEKNKKIEYEYDSYGYRSGYANYSWDPAISEWSGTERVRNTFDSLGNQLLFENFVWSAGNKRWTVISNAEYILDSARRIISIINSNFNGNLKQNTHEFDFTYDSLGNKTSEVQWVFSFESGRFERYSRSECEYDLNGHIVVRVYSEWNNADSAWSYIKREENIYNRSGIRDSSVIKFWNEALSDWGNTTKYEFQYDENENVILFTICGWSVFTNYWNCNENVEYNYNWENKLINKTKGGWNFDGHWFGKEKDDYKYDSDGNNTLMLRFYWDQNTNDWINGIKQVYKYDPIGNNTLHSYYNWDKSNGIYVPYFQYEYSFNNKYLLNDLKLPNSIIDQDPDYLSMPVQTTTFYRSGTEFAPYSRMSYYYLTYVVIDTTTSEIPSFYQSAAELSVFPNPGKDFIKISLNNLTNKIYLQMYNVNGTLVKRHVLFHNDPVDVRDLQRGLYFLKINCGSNTYRCKIILE